MAKWAGMTSQTGRLHALAGALFAFFVLWATISARPWASPAAMRDPRLSALVQREGRLRADAGLVQKIVERRSIAYRAALAKRRSELAVARLEAARAAAPAPQAAAASVRVVTLPPLVITRTS
jgi:hypothetical protein